jgi:hypothetical protein
MAERELSLRLRMPGLSAEAEAAVLAKVRELLADVAGEKRPTLEILSASREAVRPKER